MPVVGTDQGILYACQPSYGSPKKDASKQFWSKAVNPKGRHASMGSMFDDYGSSLLADSFNVHWKTALNLQLAGQNITRFIMCHDDIVPEDFFMDKLLDEMEETRADVVAVVVPIKDSRGITSTAIDDEGDWEVHRRITMQELFKLPETFHQKDIAHLSGGKERFLLANTGLWIADFTKPWRHKVHFQIHNRIAFKLAGDHWFDGKLVHSNTFIPNTMYKEGMIGQFINQVMPEDWDFSRQLGALGAKVCCTRKVFVKHMGEFPFPNAVDDWGNWEHDIALQRKWDINSQVPKVEGWLSEEEGKLLAALAKDKVVLEIGSWCGLSTVWMGRTAKKVYAVDPFNGTGVVNARNTYPDFCASIREYGLEDKVEAHVCTSDHFWMPYPMIDLVFIDGAHDEDNVKKDLDVAMSYLKSDGLIALHDYEKTEDPDVTKVVNRLLNDGSYEVVGRVDSIVVLKKVVRPVYAEHHTNGKVDKREVCLST